MSLLLSYKVHSWRRKKCGPVLTLRSSRSTLVLTICVSLAFYSFFLFTLQQRFPLFTAIHLAHNRIAYSLCISTYERPSLIVKLVKYLLLSLPSDTEIVVVDDASQSVEQKEALQTLQELSKKNKDLRVFIQKENLGPFFTKLRGFQEAVGEYILSIDDDDTVDFGYHLEIIENIDPQYDFISTFTTGYKWLKVKNTIEEWIADYPCHVFMAFRKSLLNNVHWPKPPLRIARDDAPIMLMLYIQSSTEKIKVFHNNRKYLLNKDHSIPHQMDAVLDQSKIRLQKNGYEFVVREAKRMGKFDYFEPYINKSYHESIRNFVDE